MLERQKVGKVWLANAGTTSWGDCTRCRLHIEPIPGTQGLRYRSHQCYVRAEDIGLTRHGYGPVPLWFVLHTRLPNQTLVMRRSATNARSRVRWHCSV